MEEEQYRPKSILDKVLEKTKIVKCKFNSNSSWNQKCPLHRDCVCSRSTYLHCLGYSSLSF